MIMTQKQPPEKYQKPEVDILMTELKASCLAVSLPGTINESFVREDDIII